MDNNFEQEVQEAMRILQGLSPEAISSQAISSHDSFETEVNEAMNILKNQQQNIQPTLPASSPEYTYGERGLQGVRGMAKTYGNTADLLSKGVGAGLEFPKMLAQKVLSHNPEELAKKEMELTQAQQGFNNPNFGQQLPQALDAAVGKNLEPTDTLGKFLQGTGEFLAPMPFGGAYTKAANLGAKPLVKQIGKDVAASMGASGALLTPSISDEGTPARAVEDMAKAIFGAKAGDKILSPSILRTIKQAPTKVAANIFSRGTNPNVEAIKLAKKHEIELPFNVGMNGKVHNFLANNYLKSMFVSDAYKNTINRANDSMINAVKKSIDSLGEHTLKPTEASFEYRNFLKSQEKEAEEAARALYENAATYLKPTDKVLPKHTIESIDSLRDILTSDIQSPAAKKVGRIVGELAERWGILPPKVTLKSLEDKPQLIEKVLDAFKKQRGAIQVSRLDNVRKQLGVITKYDPDVKGVESYLSKLISDISKDIENSGNTHFIEKWKGANKFFKENVAERFRTDLARSIMTGEAPIDAFNKMNSVENIKLLEKAAGHSPKAQEIVNSLKKAKVRDIFATSLSDENLKLATFTNIFTRKEKGQEVLEYLLGKTEYNKLSDISKIAKEFQKSGRDLLNTSGTAIASSDISKAERLVQTTLGTLFGGGAGYGIAGPAGATVGIASPYLLSRLVANSQFVNQARAYAIARAQGKDKYAATILNRLIKISEPEAKIALYTLINENSPEEQE